jgi:uncharacterized protein YpmS
MKFLITRILLALVVLSAASIACNLPARATDTPPTEPQLDPQTAQQLEEQYKATLDSAPPNGDVTVTITQQQLNTLIQDRIASEPDSPIQDPQVVLTNGQMEIDGTVSQAGFSINSTTVLRPGANADGSPRLEVVSIHLGSIPAPDSLEDQVGRMVDDAFQDYLTQNADQFRVSSISIGEGFMTVTGQRIQP